MRGQPPPANKHKNYSHSCLPKTDESRHTPVQCVWMTNHPSYSSYFIHVYITIQLTFCSVYHESASYYYYILYTKLSLSNFSPLRNAFSCCPFKTLPITYLLTVYLFTSNQHPYLHKDVFLEREKIAKELILPPFLNKARYLTST